MQKSSSQKKNRQKRQASDSSIQGSSFPLKLVRQGFIYVNGDITHVCRGLYTIDLENGMKCIATARKLDSLYRVSIMVGDKVTCEIDPKTFESNNANLRARIVWRFNSNR